jgi:hypothetical protein
MPQITTAIGEWESESKFVVHVKNAPNLLVSKYNITEHKAYQGLRHEWLNHIFQLAGVLCQPRPEPISGKLKFAMTGTTPTPRKTSEKWGRGRRSSHSVTQTSTQELALAKPLKCSMKFATKSSGLSPTKKASIARIEAAGKKMSSTSTAGSGATHAQKCALNLFDSGLSAFDDETDPLEWPRKCSWETSLSEDAPKSLAAKGFLSDSFFFENYD